MAHEELKLRADQCFCERGIADPVGFDFYFSDGEIDEAVHAIMSSLELVAGFWTLLEQTCVPNQESFDRAMHLGIYSERTYRPLRKLSDEQGRRLPIYRSPEEIYGDEDVMIRTDQQKVQNTKYQARRKLRHKIATSLKQFLNATPKSPLRSLVGMLLAAEKSLLIMLACPNHDPHHAANIARDLAELCAGVRRAVDELQERGECLTEGRIYFTLG